MYSVADTLAGGFPHSDISGSKLICQLPEAFRRLSRPSSPVIAKASTMCTYSLVPITLAPHELRDRHRNQEYSLIACLLILDYYPKCALLHARLKNFTSSRLLKNENYTYLKPRLYINAVEQVNGGG